MTKDVLVTYATTCGSTQEIAESIADTLKESKLSVDILRARNVKSLDGYRWVVLGAPLYMFHWHADAHHFLKKYRDVLSKGMPVAIFAGGPTEKGDAEEYRVIREQMDKELAKHPWLKPACVEIVGGRLDPALLKFPYNLIPALKQMPPRDFRDWKAIKTWANGLSNQIINSHS